MLGQFRLTGSVHQTVKDGVDVNLEQDIVAVPGWSAKLVANYPHDAAIPDGDGITYIDDRTITVLPSGEITEDGVNPGISLTANDPNLFDTPLQWTVIPGWVLLSNKRRFKPRRWTFNAPDVDEEVSIGELTPVASESMTSVARGPKGDKGDPGGMTTEELETAISDAVTAFADGAPAALNTLNELAAALGDDANFAATVTTALGNKQPLNTNLTSIAALTTTPFGRGLLANADAAAARTALNAADIPSVSASGAMRNLMSKLTENVDDATWLIVGDSTGNATNEWVYLTVQWLAAKFPAYTVNYYLWNEGGNAWPGSSPTVVQTGSGAQTLTVWNGSIPGSKTGYFQGSRFPSVVKAADLVTVSYGHNQGGPVNTDSLRQFQRNKYLSFVDEVASVNPNAGVVLILQNPSVDGAFSHDEEWQAQRATQYAQAAAYRGWGVVNVLRAFYEYGNWAADLTDPDGIHPSPAGSQLWAAQVQAALEKASRVSVTTQAPQAVAPSRQLIANPEFTEWTSTNPSGVTLSAGVTASKELTDYETGVQALTITSDTTEGAPYAAWAGTADAWGIKGMLANQTWTAAVRLKAPAANDNVVRVLMRDNNGSSQSVYTDVDDTARDRYMWTYVTKTFASNATSLEVRVLPKTYGTDAATVLVDRIYLIPGAVPVPGGMSPKIQIGPSTVTLGGGEVQTGAEANMNRLDVTGASYVTMASGTAVFSYFRAKQSITIASLKAYTGSTAAAATPTTIKLGVYSVDEATGDLTLLASTANDTTLFAATFTGYTKALSAPVALTAGNRYAYGILEVSGAAVATLQGVVFAGFQAEFFREPRLSAIVASQTDLASSYTYASLTAKNGVPYVVGLS